VQRGCTVAPSGQIPFNICPPTGGGFCFVFFFVLFSIAMDLTCFVFFCAAALQDARSVHAPTPMHGAARHQCRRQSRGTWPLPALNQVAISFLQLSLRCNFGRFGPTLFLIGRFGPTLQHPRGARRRPSPSQGRPCGALRFSAHRDPPSALRHPLPFVFLDGFSAQVLRIRRGVRPGLTSPPQVYSC